MFAVVKEGGKQYKIKTGDEFKVELRKDEAGCEVELKNVLMISDNENIQLGNPSLEGASVLCKVIEHKKEKKIIVFKHKRRKGYRKKQGHRQTLTKLKVLDIRS